MKKDKRSTLIFVSSVYFLLLFSVLFLRYGREINISFEAISERFNNYVNLTPFDTIDNYVKAVRNGNISRTVFVWNIVGNLVLFLPMGIILPKIFKRLSAWYRTLSVILCLITLIEVLQLFIGVGSLDVDDIILNFTGSVAGYVLYAVTKPRHKRKRK